MDKSFDNSWKENIDFVILWVDGNDSEWQKKKNLYTPGEKCDISESRYRDWDNLKYWFRAVAKYASWVRKVHFVSDGQVPEWLNRKCPKLHIVDHKDFIPESKLPLFNASSIEIGIHNIPGLSENFVYFNDDMFLTNYIKPEYYFKNGIPKDTPGLNINEYNTDNPTIFGMIKRNSYNIINKYFNKNEVLKKNFLKWFNPFYGKTFLRTLLNLKGNRFTGLVIQHLSMPYRKLDFKRIWDLERVIMEEAQTKRFRSDTDVNQYIFRFYRMCIGDFVPKIENGKYFSLHDDKTAKKVARAISRRKYSEICINDVWKEKEYNKAKNIINEAFERLLSEKSIFEK